MTTLRCIGRFACAAFLLAACTSEGGTLRPNGPVATASPPNEPVATGSLPNESVAEGRIVFAGEDGEIHLLELPSGDEVALTSIRGDQFDPDGHGRLVVFRDSRHGVNVDDEIYVVRSDGTGITNLSNAPDSDEWGPAWSPDGSMIAFNSDREGMPQVYVMRADGSGVERLSDVEGEYPTWSPDGSRLAFASYVGGSTPFGDPDYDVFVMDADGSNETNLTQDPDAYDMYPSWAPDGGWIAFESTRGTPEDFRPPPYDQERISDFDIWVMRSDGSDLRNITSDVRRLNKFPDWSAEGIVYVREGAIVIARPDGTDELDVSAQTGITGNFPAWVT